MKQEHLLYGRPASVFPHPPVISFDTEARHSQMNYPSHKKLNATLCNTHWLKYVPVISTAHITKEDGKALEDGYASLDQYSDGAANLVRTDINHHWSDPCGNMLRKFAALGYRWIILDGEGDKVDGLETFDW